ncbi:Glutathione S-transferase, N-terminal domain, partial [Rhizoctonia solani]
MAATMENPIVFYDLADANNKPWGAANIRVVSAIYPTRYASIKVKSTTADPSADPDGEPTYVSDSFKIALYLDDKYPAPEHPAIFSPGTRGLQSLLVSEYFPTLISVIVPLSVPCLPRILDSRSIEYIRRTRGTSLISESAPKEIEPKLLKEAQQKFEALLGSLALNNESGPFVMGNQVSFIDFCIGGLFEFVQRSDTEDSTIFKELLSWSDGKLAVYWERIKQIERASSEINVET